MPPSSRKRNKGKDRKAKKLENERVQLHSAWSSLLTLQACDHGCSMIPDDLYNPCVISLHPVSAFLDEYYAQFRRKKDGMDILIRTFNTHPQIWDDATNREILLNVLITIGTNLLIEDGKRRGIRSPTCQFSEVLSRNAEIIISFERYGETNSFNSAFFDRAIVSKKFILIPVLSSIRRDLLKFYRKRTSCSCLKKLHLEARKTITKMAKCSCGVEKERLSLSTCSRCMIVDYCSRQCQVADWSDHRACCDAIVEHRQE